MKAPVFVLAGFALCGAARDCSAATLTFAGGLPYAQPFPGATTDYIGNTYLAFIMDQPGHFDYTTQYLLGAYFRVMLFTGSQSLLTGVVPDIRWFHELGEVRFSQHNSGELPAGSYLLTVWGENSEWDWMDYGYVPSAPFEGSEVPGPPGYRITMNGDFRPVSIWGGQPDGSFRITNLPESDTLALAAAALAVLSFRRRLP